MKSKIPKEQIERLIFDDGRRIEFKIKIKKFPFLLKTKLDSMSKLSGRNLEDIVTMMLDNEVKSVEKVLGKDQIE